MNIGKFTRKMHQVIKYMFIIRCYICFCLLYGETNLLRRVVVRHPYHTTLQTSQDFSRIFKNGKESKMDETDGFVIKIDVQKRRFCPQEPHCYKKAKKIYGISWVLYFLQWVALLHCIRHLENVNRIPWRKDNEEVSHTDYQI